MYICTFIYTFSIFIIGIGFALTMLGNLLFILTFHCNLHSLRDQPSTTQPKIFKYLSSPCLITCYIIMLFLFIFIFTFFHEIPNIYLVHIMMPVNMTFLFILVPRYYINQDPNLKFYVSVYHYQPPPVLPWHLPKNFNHKSVKLLTVNPKNE